MTEGGIASVDETALQRWRRRAVTVPLYLLLGIVSIVALPLTALLALIVDALRRQSSLPTLRFIAALTIYFGCEAFGIVVSAGLWLLAGTWAGRSPDRFVRWNLALQPLWARMLFGGASRVFAMRTEVAGAECLTPGPILLFARHASTLDTLLPTIATARRGAMQLRHVMKRELLWDPCLDIVGQRTHQVFIRRGTGDREREIDALRRLAGDLGPRDGVLLFPEGTRFSPSKLRHAVGRLAEGESERRSRAESFRHVLPPRTGGALALLDSVAHADVVFLAHTGFEGTASLKDIWRGKLIGRTIQLAFWRVAAASIPREAAARVAWLDGQWAKIDEWIDARRSATDSLAATPRSCR